MDKIPAREDKPYTVKLPRYTVIDVRHSEEWKCDIYRCTDRMSNVMPHFDAPSYRRVEFDMVEVRDIGQA